MRVTRLARALGQRIQQAREAGSMSKVQLAAAAKLSRNTVTNIEAGTHSVTLSNLYAIAIALGVEPAQLLPALSEVRSDSAELTLAEEKRKVGGLSKKSADTLASIVKLERGKK